MLLGGLKKIALLMPDADRLEEVKRLFAEYHAEVVFEVASLRDGVQVEKKLMEKGIEVVIARGENAANIKRAYPEVVVIDVSITGFDLVRAVENRLNVWRWRWGFISKGTI